MGEYFMQCERALGDDLCLVTPPLRPVPNPLRIASSWTLPFISLYPCGLSDLHIYCHLSVGAPISFGLFILLLHAK